MLLDKEIYRKYSQRSMIVKDYYKVLEIYIKIIEYYNKMNELVESPEDIPVPDEINPEEQKILVYTTLNNNNARLISDMGDIPYEYYEEVYDLIIKFKEGSIPNNKIKTITNKRGLTGYIELKSDQVRIILKHIKNNIYNVYGVFAKKANNDRETYRTIMNRPAANISTEELLSNQLILSNKIEEELETLVKEKGRKGTR